MNIDAISNVVSNQFARTSKMDSTVGSLERAAKDPSKMSKEEIKMVAKEFESLFLGEMLTHMMGDSLGDAAFGSEETDEIYKSMMVENYAKAITNKGGIGIAGYIENALTQRALLSAQEV
jgi:Rod binding domain-containing protein